MNFFQKKRIYSAKGGARGGRRQDLGGLFVRSRWEANVARWLNELQRTGQISSWRYEPREFEFPVKRGTRFYKPDFEVAYSDGVVRYIECKGFMARKDVTTLTRMAKYHPAVPILLIGKREYEEIESEFGNLPNWER